MGHRRRIAGWACAAAVAAGCGGPPAPPPVDPAAEQEDERLIREAGKAERGVQPRPKGKGKATTPPTRNPDDDD